MSLLKAVDAFQYLSEENKLNFETLSKHADT